MTRPSLRSLTPAVCLLILVAGCGSTADVFMKDGTLVQGEITSGNRNTIYVNADGEEVTVPRSQIKDIDHPGNGVATVGLILGAYGALNIAVGASKCHEEGKAFCTAVFVPAAVGVALATYGLAVWGSSRKAVNSDVNDRDVELVRVLLTPSYFYAAGKGSPGLALVSRF